MRLLLGVAVWTTILAAPFAGTAQGHYTMVAGSAENFMLLRPKSGGATVAERAAYLQIELAPTRPVGVELGVLHTYDTDQLDETYVRADGAHGGWRIGRFRSAFGLGGWSDLYYTGFPALPLVRSQQSPTGFELTRLDTGADFRGESRGFEYVVGWVDTYSAPYQVVPAHAGEFAGRAQTQMGDAIIGLNSLLPAGRGVHLYSVDLRWSRPQIYVRGEAITGDVRGYYADIYVHPIALHKTTFLARLEGMRAGKSSYTAYTVYASQPVLAETDWISLFTVGIKQVVSPLLTLSGVHGWGNGAANHSGSAGWLFQAQTSYHF